MQSNNQETPDSYLRNTIIDGTKPFLYRGGLCSLLGIPDIYACRPMFRPPLPSVGFRYVNHRLMGEPFYIPQYSLNEGRPSATHNILTSEPNGSQRIHQEHIQSNEHIEEINREVPDTYERTHHLALERKIIRDNAVTKERVQQGGSMQELKHEEASGESHRRAEKPGEGLKRANMEIPCVSERCLKSPNIGGSVKSQYSKRNDTLSDIDRERYQYKPFLPGTGEGIVRKSLLGAQSNKTKINSIKTFASAQERLQRKHSFKQVGTEDGENNPPIWQGEGRRESQRKDVPSRPIGINPVYQYTRSRPDRIEQLRYAVHELASKVSLKQAKRNEEIKQQQQAERATYIPPQRIVIIKGPSPRARPPCAFWERSYLGRFHLRSLR